MRDTDPLSFKRPEIDLIYPDFNEQSDWSTVYIVKELSFILSCSTERVEGGGGSLP